MSKIQNILFNPQKGLVRGRSLGVEIFWYLIKMFFFLSAFPWPSSFKSFLLRIFGAKIGKGVYIKPMVNIHMPWKLEIGNFTWIGEQVIILNFEPVKIGSNVCISQRAFICTGNHDYRDVSMKYKNDPITIKDGAWIGAQVFVCPGVIVSEYAMAMVGSVVTRNLPPEMICSGNPCIPVKHRFDPNTQ